MVLALQLLSSHNLPRPNSHPHQAPVDPGEKCAINSREMQDYPSALGQRAAATAPAATAPAAGRGSPGIRYGEREAVTPGWIDRRHGGRLDGKRVLEVRVDRHIIALMKRERRVMPGEGRGGGRAIGAVRTRPRVVMHEWGGGILRGGHHSGFWRSCEGQERVLLFIVLVNHNVSRRPIDFVNTTLRSPEERKRRRETDPSTVRRT